MPLSRDSSSNSPESIKKQKSKTSSSSSQFDARAILAPRDYREALTAEQLSQLAENEHHRYPPNGKKIAHAVIVESDGKKTALQYEVPDNAEGMPDVRPLTNIEEIEPFRGMKRYQATTPGGTVMYAKRFIFGKAGDATHEMPVTVACFSPSEKPGKQPFWGSIKPTPIFRGDLSKSQKKELDEELKEIGKISKGGEELVVDNASVPQRDLIKTRTPSQNTVMGESARDAYEHFFDKLSEELSPEMTARLKRSFQADIKAGLFKNSYRPEWLHRHGWSLAPMNIDPQTQDNLGAAPKWANTQMMILERMVKWFAINAPESKSTIKAKFDMLLDSELIERIDFETKIEMQQRYVKWMQDIDPFLAYPILPKASDIAQGTAVSYSVLNGIPPVSQQDVKSMKKVALRPQTASTTLSSSEDQLSFLVQAPSAVISKPSSNETVSFLPQKSKRAVAKGSFLEQDSSSLEDETVEASVKKSAHYTRKNIYKSVVQVYTRSLAYDYDTPWRAPEEQACSGSGVVIRHQGKNYILTNAHVVENAIYVQIRLANDRKRKYEVKPKCVSYQCDLALLEVDDPAFDMIAEPAQFGDMVDLQQQIMTVGFPMGGSEISVSKGITSRVEVRDYCMSGLDMLQVQIDAAVNSGNSGGPVFSGNKVVGITFQGYGLQGLGYMIPIPIVNHFLTEAFSQKAYRGFPIIPFHSEALENEDERDFYHLGDRTGIRIKKVNILCDAYEKLKPDDILLSIDGFNVSNEGTVDIPGVGDCIDLIHVTHSKYIGDTVRLEVLRKNPETDEAKILKIEVVLDVVPGDTEKVSVPEQDKMPTYYINSALCFVPLTRNYLEGEGGVFEEMVDFGEGCSLAELSKKNKDEQVMVLSHILACRETQGYHKHINEIVKEINGIPINNIRDVVHAMESNKSLKHVITLVSKSKIILPNMSVERLHALLDRHHIPVDRSKDLLKPFHQPMHVDEVVSSAGPVVIEKLGRSSQKSKQSIVLLEDEDDMEQDSKPVSKKLSASVIKERRTLPMLHRRRIESSEEEEAANIDNIEPARKKLAMLFEHGHPGRKRKAAEDSDLQLKRKQAGRKLPEWAANLSGAPGLNRYMGALDKMEAFYQEHAEAADEDDDVDFERLSEDYASEDVTTEEVEDSMEDDDVEEAAFMAPVRPLLKRRNAMVPNLSFFNSASVEHGGDEEEQQSPSSVLI